MQYTISRRSLLLSALGGAAGLACNPARGFARWAIPPKPLTRPTLVWIVTGANATGLDYFWKTPPSQLTAQHTLHTLGSSTRAIAVSPEHLVQLKDGRILSPVATQRDGRWVFGLVDFTRVAHEGWHEWSVVAGSSPTPAAQLQKAAAALIGHRAPLEVLTEPNQPVRSA